MTSGGRGRKPCLLAACDTRLFTRPYEGWLDDYSRHREEQNIIIWRLLWNSGGVHMQPYYYLVIVILKRHTTKGMLDLFFWSSLLISSPIPWSDLAKHVFQKLWDANDILVDTEWRSLVEEAMVSEKVPPQSWLYYECQVPVRVYFGCRTAMWSVYDVGMTF